METKCPNCGHSLAQYRTDRQVVRSGEMTMFWNICPRCHHVALERWLFAAGAGAGGLGRAGGTPPPGRRNDR